MDTLTMETDLTAKIAEVNDWIDEHHGWFIEKKRQYGCAEHDLKIPRLVDINTTLHAAALYRQRIEERIMDATVWKSSALAIHNSASAVAAHQRGMSKRHDCEGAIESAIEEASAAEAVARTALAVSRYYTDVINTLPHYKFYINAQVVATETVLKIGAADVAAQALKSFRGYQFAMSKTFESTKAGKDAYHTHMAALSVGDAFEAIWPHLRDQVWREASKTGTPTTDTGAPTAGIGPPIADIGPPTAGIGPPIAGIGPPTTDIGAPTTDTGAPTAAIGAPAADIGAPTAYTGSWVGKRLSQLWRTIFGNESV